jgi:hypothetical protein
MGKLVLKALKAAKLLQAVGLGLLLGKLSVTQLDCG